MHRKLATVFKNNSWLPAFLIICLISAAVSYYINHFLISKEMIFDSMREQLSSERVEEMLSGKAKYVWLSYIISPVIKFVIILIISGVILTGIHLKSYKISFKKILTVVVYCEFIFLLPLIIKVLYFSFFKNDYSLDEFSGFSPHSLLYYIDKSSVSQWFHYPIYLVNIFQLLSWFILAFGINKVSDLSFKKSFLLIMQTYVPAVVFWAVIMVFIAVSFG